MDEEIFAVANCICNVSEAEQDYLSALCRAERAQLETRLQADVNENTHAIFICAAAWLAAADYFSGKGASGAASWKAGDVTVEERSATACGAAAENLRHAAEILLRGLTCDEGFAFLGVRG